MRIGVAELIRFRVGSLGRVGFAVFNRVHLGSFERAKRSQVSFGFAYVHSVVPSGRRVYSEYRGFSPAHIGLFVFALVHLVRPRDLRIYLRLIRCT